MEMEMDMDLELTLLPLTTQEPLKATSVICRTQLQFDQNSKIFDQLRSSGDDADPIIKTIPFPESIKIKIGLRTIRRDGYGQPLTFVYARDLRSLQFGRNATVMNEAIQAFLAKLPNNVPVILYWH